MFISLYTLKYSDTLTEIFCAAFVDTTSFKFDMQLKSIICGFLCIRAHYL